MCGSDVSKEYLKRFPAIVIKLKVIVANKRNQVSRNTLFVDTQMCIGLELGKR